jgi:hypothetical protein
MRSHTDVHLSMTPRPDEGDRCAQCDRAFEIGDEVHTQAVTGVRKNNGDPLAFRHYHDGCWLFAQHDTETPVKPRISGFHCLDHDSKASAA